MTNISIASGDSSISLKQLSVQVSGESQAVITLPMMDEAHKRPSGTARRSFNKHKYHLSSGKHYFVRNTSEAKKEFGITAPSGLTLLTERGYLMVVKSFTDDLAWEVQDKLIDGYFRSKKPPQPQPLPEKLPIKTRDDLSFTARNSKGNLINWLVPHDTRSFWDEGLKVGRSHFEEVIELAENSEDEAFNAIRFAISCSEGFERGKAGNFQSNGWGIEMGFCDEIAKAVIVGLRALKYGAEPFSEGGKKRKRMVKKS